MKLKAIYDDVEARVISKVNEEDLIKHIRMVYNMDGCKDLLVRIPNDIKNALFSPKEICSWYDEYDCNDTHITTLFRKIIQENYREGWRILKAYSTETTKW